MESYAASRPVRAPPPAFQQAWFRLLMARYRCRFGSADNS